jgi:hypothetical protein
VTWVSPVVTWENADKKRRALLEQAWSQGELSWKLNPNQFGVYKLLREWEAKAGAGRMFCLDISRRYGKSTMMLSMAFEDAIKNKGWRIPYCAPTYKMVTEILVPLINTLIADCPDHLRPKYWPSRHEVVFQNGSSIKIVGLDVNPDGARGTHLDRAYLDECGFFDSLEYLLHGILYPQMQMRPHARIYAGSTPPVSPSHYWSEELIPQARNDGRCITRTIEDNPMLSDEEREEFITAAGGRKSVTCRREYFCHHITDDTLAIIPEFREAEEFVVQEVKPPNWRDCYVSMDPGWADLTAVLFGYWWFERRAFVVEDEVVEGRKNSREIADLIKAKEKALWSGVKRHTRTDDKPRVQPYRRVSDNDHRLIHDLTMEHGLAFVPTQKDQLQQQINSLRIAVQQHKVIIHPRCKVLISHLRNGVWKNAEKKKFAVEGKSFGHFDAIAALVYAWRNVDQFRNPYPPAERYVAGIRVKTGEGTGIAKQSRWSRRGKAG